MIIYAYSLQIHCKNYTKFIKIIRLIKNKLNVSTRSRNYIQSISFFMPFINQNLTIIITNIPPITPIVINIELLCGCILVEAPVTVGGALFLLILRLKLETQV